MTTVVYRQFPKELQEQAEYQTVVADYLKTYSDALVYENRSSSPENILEACEMLNLAKARHSGVVPGMARACKEMRLKYSLNIDDVGSSHGLTRAVQYCLDRLYLHRF